MYFVFGLFETFFESEAKSDRLVLPSSCVSFSFAFFFFFFFFLGSDSKGNHEKWSNHSSHNSLNGSLLFWHKPVLKLKEPWLWKVRGFSGRTVRSGPGFKTLFITLSIKKLILVVGSIRTSNNLLLKICYKIIVKIL